MKKLYRYFSVVFLSTALLAGFFAPSLVHTDMPRTSTKDCLAQCSRQNSQIGAALNELRQEAKDVDPAPDPFQEPYYAFFQGLSYAAVTVAAAYLIRYLKWRPPDLITLYGVYRI